MSKSVCSVYGCSNSSKKSKKLGIQISFYRFPSRPWEKERKDAWIRFAKRQNQDGSQWSPSKYAVICSKHFVGGKKSEHPQHPNYVPSIYPMSLSASKGLESQKIRRFDRAMTRAVKQTFKIQTETGNHIQMDNQILNMEPSVQQKPEVKFSHQSTQVQAEMIDITVDSTLFSRSSCRQPSFYGFESVKQNPKAFHHLTGVSTEIFNLLLSTLSRPPPKQTSLSLENNLMMTLMKLKNGLTFTALSALFNIDNSAISRTFNLIISSLYVATSSWVFFPSKEAILDTMPDAFKSNYKSCRVIIDCTEMKTETPGTVFQKTHMYSNYKGCYTVKYLIGITPRGFISFISKGYGGRATDSFITNDCGILNLLEAGDTIMADKGFPQVNVQDNVVIVMPPFSKGRNYQFSTDEVDQTYDIASLRIHVERCIQRIKTFNILSNKIPMSTLKNLDKIMHVCCVLVNLSSPIIK